MKDDDFVVIHNGNGPLARIEISENKDGKLLSQLEWPCGLTFGYVWAISFFSNYTLMGSYYALTAWKVAVAEDVVMVTSLYRKRRKRTSQSRENSSRSSSQ